MNDKIVITIIFVLIAIAGGVWLYLYNSDPLHTSCAKINADHTGLADRAADALYDSLSDAAKAHTKREAVRMYLITECETAADDQSVTYIRDRLEQTMGSQPAPAPAH